MKFTINTELLKGVLRSVSGGLGGITLGSRSIKIIANENNLVIMTNNAKVAYRATVPATIIEQGSVLLDGAFFTSMVGASQEPEITVTKTDHHVNIKDGKRRTSLGIIETEDFLDTFAVENSIATLDNASVLQGILKAASYTTSVDNSSPYAGIFMDNNFVISTDGVKATIVPFENNLTSPIVFSRESISEINKFDINGQIELLSDGNFLSIILGNEDQELLFTCQLLDINFPPVVDHLLNRLTYENHVSINCKDFDKELTYVSLVSDNKDQVVNLGVNTDGVVTMSANAYMGTNQVQTEMFSDVIDSDINIPLEFKFKVTSFISLMRVMKEIMEEQNFQLFYGESTTPLKLVCGELIMFLTSIRDV